MYEKIHCKVHYSNISNTGAREDNENFQRGKEVTFDDQESEWLYTSSRQHCKLKGQQSNAFMFLREDNLQLRLPYPARLSNEDKNTF